MKNLFIIFLLISFACSAQTTYYISNAGSSTNNGTSSATPWNVSKFLSFYNSANAAGNSFLFKRGETFYIRPLTANGTNTNRIYWGAYGTGANPIISGFCTIKSSAWTLYSTNVWKAVITNSANVTGFVPTQSNCGMIKVDGMRHGIRRGLLSGLKFQWDFYCDFGAVNKGAIYVYSTTNPSTHTIQASNALAQMGDYTTIENLWFIGSSGEGIQIVQPIKDTIRYCRIREIGGEMKSLTDTTRQGACISFYSGATNSYCAYDTVELSYEDAVTEQTHQQDLNPVAFSGNKFEYIITDSCENGFNATLQKDGAPGYINDTVRYCRFNNVGYAWAHPPQGKPQDNMSAAIMSHGWQQLVTDNKLVFIHDTIYHPLGGAYFLAGVGTTIPFTSIQNEIYMDSLTHVRKNCWICSNTYTWLFNEGNNGTFTTASGADVGTNWHCLDCHENVSNTYYLDADADGFGNLSNPTTSTVQPVGYVNNGLDCNDADATINPNTAWYHDIDGDGYYTDIILSCTSPGGGYTRSMVDSGDCNDNDNTVHPGATELCDGIDNDCNGFIDDGVQTTYYRDSDGDGYGDPSNTLLACSLPTGYVTDNTDCNDNSNSIHPGATEILNGVDDNCNGLIDEGEFTYQGLRVADTSCVESSGTVNVRIYLNEAATVPIQVDYYLVNGSATFPKDYKQIKGTLQFNIGDITKFIPVSITKDKISETTENFYLQIFNAVNASIADDKGEVQIINNP